MIEIHGYCAAYCQNALDGELPDNGADSTEHGRWCRSTSVAAQALDAQGNPFTVYAEANSDYVNGDVTDERIKLRNKLHNVVGLYMRDADDPVIALSPGEARQLAAALTYLADVASRIDGPAPRIARL